MRRSTTSVFAQIRPPVLTSPVSHALIWAMAALMLAATPGTSAASDQAADGEAIPNKAGTIFCNSTFEVQTLCSGDYSDIVQSVRVDATGKVWVALTQAFIDEVEANQSCVLTSGVYAKATADGDGGEENQLNTLYVSWSTNAHVAIKVAPLIADGTCYLKNLTALFGEQP